MKKTSATLVVFATLIQVGLSVEIVEVGDDSNFEDSMCKCQPFKSCDWSDKLTKQISVLSKNHPQWKILAQQFFLQICQIPTATFGCSSPQIALQSLLAANVS